MYIGSGFIRESSLFGSRSQAYHEVIVIATLFLKQTFRSLFRRKTFSFINIFGLALGIACSTLLILFVQYETSYDRHFTNADRIHRLVFDVQPSEDIIPTCRSPWLAGPTLKEDYPGVEEVVRFRSFRNTLIEYETEQFTVESSAAADSTTFSVFSFDLLTGQAETVLNRPNTIVLREDLAQRLFGNINPIGQTVRINNTEDYEVTGVYAQNQHATHLDFEYMTSFVTLTQPSGPDNVNSWYSIAYFTYLLLTEDADPAQLEAELPGFLDRHIGGFVELYGMRLYAHMQPLPSIHLHSNLFGEVGNPGSFSQVIVFSTIALLVLLIACINFINLSTAQSANRAREAGIRKVFGANRNQLIREFYGEAAVMTTIAFLVALGLTYLFLPMFNHFTGYNFSLDFLHNHVFDIGYLLLFIITTVLAGSVPAFAFSAFRPASVLRGQIKHGPSGSRLRTVFVIFQFTASIILLIGTLVVYRQMGFLQSHDLGFNKDNVIFLRLSNHDLRQQVETMKTHLMEDPSIVSATASSSVPGSGFPVRLFMPEGIPDDEVREAALIIADYEYVETLGIELADGRYYNRDMLSDSVNYVINETLAEQLGWDDPVGREFDFPPRGVAPGRVIGVVKDYHFQSLHQPVPPLVIHMTAEIMNLLSVRYVPGRETEALAHIEAVWNELAPGWPFDYYFLDSYLTNLYSDDKTFGDLVGIFAILSVIVACLGLFGLAAYVAEQRTREIGVRKVLGASSQSIVMLLSRDFLSNVAIAFLFAAPLGWFVMDHYWLETFAYHTSVGIHLIFAAGLIAAAIAMLTVSTHAIRAAHSNPVDSIRNE